MGIVTLPNLSQVGTNSWSDVEDNDQAITAQVNGNLDATNLASNAVTTSKIQDDAVTADKVADEAIDAAAKLGSNVVTTAKIADANVTYAKLATFAYISVQDQKASGTDGGTFTSGAWQTRTLNTEVVDTGSDLSLDSNQMTLTAGTYRIRASAPGAHCFEHKARLQNVTDATTVLLGTSELAAVDGSGFGSQTRSIIEGRFTVAASKALEIQHRCFQTRSSFGFGVGEVTFGVTEIFTTVELWRES